jgi:indolepyruvate ferredoxin oxidoreductase alpha subunit
MKLGCPAISSDGDGVKIDLNQCNGCGLCVNVCPFDAIKKEED